jgi:uncharacterized protein
MRQSTLATIFQRLGELNCGSRSIEVIWHAGEPMAVGAAWYREAFDTIQKSAPSHFNLNYAMQTNGTLISDEWCLLLKEHNIRLGISIDGPESIHNKHRTRRNGNGTFKKVMEGISLLDRHNIRYGVICVVTEHSVHQHNVLFDFFMTLESRSIAFNCEEKKGTNQNSRMSAKGNQERYKMFLRSFWERARESGDHWYIRDIDEFTDILMGTASNQKYYNVFTLGSILSFTVDGQLTTFSPELLNARHRCYDTFALGDITEHKLLDLLNSEKAQIMDREIKAGIAKCKSECEFFVICGGGDPSSKIFETDSFSSSETAFCQATVKIAGELVLENLDTFLEIFTS